jgi:hypothetical protein
MSTQPWKPSWFRGKNEDHPREDLIKLWHDMRAEAVLNGYTPQLSNNTFGEYNIIGQ